MAMPKNYITPSCLICGNICTVTRKIKSKAKYCSITCAQIPRRKTLENPYRRKNKQGYIELRYFNKDLGKNSIMLEHRYIWEKHYGPIPDDYVIHHINHVRDDNRLENFQLMEKQEHIDYHLRKYDLYPNNPTNSDYAKRWREKNPERYAESLRKQSERKKILYAERKRVKNCQAAIEDHI